MKINADIELGGAVRDPVAERAERQMRVMAQLSEIGMGLARTLQTQVCDGGPVTMRGDPVLMFVRIARTVRQCIALEAKIAEALREWLGLSEAERAERRAVVGAKAAEAAAGNAPEELEEIEPDSDARRFERDHRETERGERAERFWADSYVIEDEGSFLEIVTKVCRDLGVTPDWSSWSEDGPGDLRVRADEGGAGFWSAKELDLAAGPVGHVPPPRGPPS
jgi:hypothetical protein